MTERWASITTFLPGATAERVESLVTEPMETRLREIPEISTIESNSRAGYSLISLQLYDHVSANETDVVWSEIRDKLAEAHSELPEATTVPLLQMRGTAGLHADRLPFLGVGRRAGNEHPLAPRGLRWKSGSPICPAPRKRRPTARWTRKCWSLSIRTGFPLPAQHLPGRRTDRPFGYESRCRTAALEPVRPHRGSRCGAGFPGTDRPDSSEGPRCGQSAPCQRRRGRVQARGGPAGLHGAARQRKNHLRQSQDGTRPAHRSVDRQRARRRQILRIPAAPRVCIWRSSTTRTTTPAPG